MHPKTSRRDFLKSSIYLGVGLNLFGLMPQLVATEMAKSAQNGTRYTYHTCPRNCYDFCSLIAEHKDGKLVRILGDPDHPITAGTPCVKGQTHAKMHSHADRVLYPMKRVGKKGEGKFVRISWDEAYDTMVAKMKECIKEYGAQSIMPYNFSGTWTILSQFGVPWRFFNKVGSTLLTYTVCEAAGEAALTYGYGSQSGVEPEGFAHTNCYISWGCNEAHTSVHNVKFINAARDKGAKLIVVDPVRTPLASQADCFVQIAPGSDAAFALGVANVLIQKGLYDKDFVAQNAIGLDELAKKAAEYPLDRVLKICKISEAEFNQFIDIYSKARPAVIRVGFGMQRRGQGGAMVRAISLLPALMGDIGVKGGGFSYINFAHHPFNFDYIRRNDLAPSPAPRVLNVNELGKILTGNIPETKELPIKFLINFNGNPLPSSPNINLVKEGLSREDLFTVVHDVYMTDTAKYADLLLPAPHFLEYEDVSVDYLGYYIKYNSKAYEPMGESKPNYQFFNELAKKMGFTDDCFDESPADVIRNGLSKDPKFAHITYENLVKNKWQKVELDLYADHNFNTPSGKIELFSKKAVDEGFHGVSDWAPDTESEERTPELFKKYPLILLTPSAAQLLNGQWHNEPLIAEVLGEPYIIINEADAKSRGIQKGDFVFAFNDRGRVKLRAKLTKGQVKPGVAMSYKSFWEKVTGIGTINELTPDTLTDITGTSAFHSNLIQIQKA